jgi:hypothetical protein
MDFSRTTQDEEIRPRLSAEGGTSVLKTKGLFLGLTTFLVAGLALGSAAVPNWSTPATWTPTRSGGLHTLTDVTVPLPFVAVDPCRVADTRGNGFTGAYGPPSIGANATRTFVITGQCGIPASAKAVSFNFGALNIGGAGDLRVFPAGGSTPLVSTMNYNANTPNIANAAVVPLGIGGDITVQADAVTIDLIIDVNGYYPSPPGSINNQEAFALIGSYNGSGILYGENSATPFQSSGVRGISTATGGITWGVQGQSFSNTGRAAGVAGVDFSGIPLNTSITNQPSGVLGLSQSHVGVEGDSYSVGVRGEVLNTAGTILAVGLVAFHQGGITPHDYAFYSNGDYGGVGAKFFVEPHATDPGLVIRYVALEGNESGTYFRGTANTFGGEAVIDVPEDFRMVTDSEGLTVQLTPVGRSASMFVVSEDLNQIVVRSSRDVKFHYQINGIRRAFKNFVPIGEGQEFMPNSVASPGGLAGYPEEIQKRLIANGTYNADGTINMETARRLGWTKTWDGQAKPAVTKPKIE